MKLLKEWILNESEELIFDIDINSFSSYERCYKLYNFTNSFIGEFNNFIENIKQFVSTYEDEMRKDILNFNKRVRNSLQEFKKSINKKIEDGIKFNDEFVKSIDSLIKDITLRIENTLNAKKADSHEYIEDEIEAYKTNADNLRISILNELNTLIADYLISYENYNITPPNTEINRNVGSYNGSAFAPVTAAGATTTWGKSVIPNFAGTDLYSKPFERSLILIVNDNLKTLINTVVPDYTIEEGTFKEQLLRYSGYKELHEYTTEGKYKVVHTFESYDFLVTITGVPSNYPDSQTGLYNTSAHQLKLYYKH